MKTIYLDNTIIAGSMENYLFKKRRHFYRFSCLFQRLNNSLSTHPTSIRSTVQITHIFSRRLVKHGTLEHAIS